MTRALSLGQPGTLVGRDPVAITACWKVRICFSPPPFGVISSEVASRNAAIPWMKVIFRSFATWPTPPVSCVTTLFLKARTLSMSIDGGPKLTPHASACSASFTSAAMCSSAFDGMQPR